MENVKYMKENALIVEAHEVAEALNKRKLANPEGNLPVPLLIRSTFLTEELKERGYTVILQKTYLIIKEDDEEKDVKS